MRITICRITLHENVFYASREIGRLYETERYLHSYALSYAMRFVAAPYFQPMQVPNYRAELETLNQQGIYVTAAHPLHVTFALNTFKYANNNYHADSGKMKQNTPSFGRLKELAVGSQFECAVLTANDRLVSIPRWIRLGLWLGKAQVEVMGSEIAKATSVAPHRAAFPLNPLDIQGEVLLWDLIAMPPVSLFDRAEIKATGWQAHIGGQSYWLPANLAYRFA